MPLTQPIIKAPNGQTKFGVSNNVTRETFKFVQENPGCTRAKATEVLIARGFKTNSVTSILNQLVTAKQVEQSSDGKLRVVVDQYTPLNPRILKEARAEKLAALAKKKRMANIEKAWAARSAKAAERRAATAAQQSIAKEEPKQKYPLKEAAGITALSTTSSTVPTPALPLVELTADKILDTLGVRQAKVLYAELKKIFEE